MKHPWQLQLPKGGFTLAEVLIAVALVALIFFAVIANWKRQINRGYDALRKKHLTDIKRAFEEYYNDKGCYPDASVMNELDDCGSANLAPYLATMPCDPISKIPYKYVEVLNDQGQPCGGFRVFAGLQDTGDTDIGRLGCNGVTGCGYGPEYNYGISSGVTVPLPGFDPEAPPPPTLPPQSGQYACDSSYICNSFEAPQGPNCPMKFEHEHCCVTPECKACGDNECFKALNACAQPSTPVCYP